MVDASGNAATLVALSHQLWSCHVSAASASSHSPLTTRVDACCWRAQQLLGAPDPSLPREGVFAGQAPRGYYRCSGYRGIPVHLLLGSFNGPALAQGWNGGRSPVEKTLMRRRLMRRTTAKTTKDQKTSSRATSLEGMDHIHVSSVHFRTEQEDKDRRLRTVHATPTGRRPAFAVPV
jgi:hypothetical protein